MMLQRYTYWFTITVINEKSITTGGTCIICLTITCNNLPAHQRSNFTDIFLFCFDVQGSEIRNIHACLTHHKVVPCLSVIHETEQNLDVVVNDQIHFVNSKYMKLISNKFWSDGYFITYRYLFDDVHVPPPCCGQSMSARGSDCTRKKINAVMARWRAIEPWPRWFFSFFLKQQTAHGELYVFSLWSQDMRKLCLLIAMWLKDSHKKGK